MCFKRKVSLGKYNATKEQWVTAYRLARLSFRLGNDPDAKLAGIYWKAVLIVYNERDAIDLLTIPATVRLESLRVFDQIMAE